MSILQNGKTQWLQHDGGSVAYDDTGSGPLVVCVPGIGETRGEYRFLVPPLRDAGYRVVTMDLRGHGESSAGRADYGPAALGGDILALIRRLDAGPALVIGNSMGCAAAAWAAAESPDLVDGLVLIGPAVRDGMPGWLMHLIYTPLFIPPWGVAVWGRYYHGLYKTAHPADSAAYEAALLANLREPGRLTALRRMSLAPKAPATNRLGQVHTPTLVVMGTGDPDFKDAAAEGRWVADQVHGRLKLVPGAGHYPHVECAAQVNPTIVDFVRQTAARSHAA